MKITNNALLFSIATSLTAAQECINNGWAIEFQGDCNYDNILEAYSHQIFHGVTGAEACGAESTPEADLDAKLELANITIEALCQEIYDEAKVKTVPFTDAAKKGDDLHFESMFYNGRSEWQEEVQTNYESEDGTATSILKQDAEAVRDFYEGVAEHERVSWPGSLTNFQSDEVDADGMPTCKTGAAMCVWPKDRQANDNNGNCAKPYDINCVDKDPADNTDLCFVDSSRGPASNELGTDEALYLFPGDNNNGEGAIHCHGLAWSNDVDHASARYKANNLFYVSMYDHMYVRGYVKNIPGAPMCGCVEQMPTVSRCDCTQIDLTETIKITYDSFSNAFEGKIIDIDIDFNACKGINNRNNDLWAYMARLYYEGEVTNEQFGELGRIITDNGCDEATKYQLNQAGLTRGYVHDEDNWSFVAGRDDMSRYHDGYGNKAFARAMDTASSSAPNGILYRICPNCVETHQQIYYRRLTEIPESFDLLENILYRGDNGGGNNVWGEDFSMHSTYEDALSGANPWKCPGDSYSYGSGFPGNCSPSGAQVKNQQSRFNKNEQKNVAFYVNKPEHAQLQVAPTTAVNSINAWGNGGWGSGVAVLDDESGTIYMTGSGSDIWHTSDDFNYYSQRADGDQTVTVNLSSQSHIWFDQWSKAGIMLRTSMEPDSPHVSVLLTGSRGICTISRSGAYNGNPEDKRSYNRGCKYSGAKSAWLKIEKRMDTFSSYVGTDDGSGDITWTQMYSFDFPYVGDEFHIGLAVCSKRWVEMEAVFENYSVESYFFPSAAPSISSAPSSFDDESMDIGNVGIAGSVMKTSAGQFLVTGSGSDIWGRSDQFHFDQHSVYGDLSIEMHIDSFDVNNEWGKGGLMIRDTLAANSKHFSVFMTKDGNRLANQWRGCTNCNSGHNAYPYIWDRSVNIKITKTGNVFEAFTKKLNEDEWQKFGVTREIDFTNEYFYVGIAVCSHDNSKTAELKGEGLKITGDSYYFPSAAPSISSAPTAYINSLDIGSVGIAGSAVKSSTGQVTVTGSGYDIWGRNDQFHFVKRPASGDISVEMLVEDFVSVGHWWAKGGIMIRDTLATNSMHYSLLLTKSGNSLANQFRSCTNCGSGHYAYPTIKDRSLWLKITKIGNVFEAFTKKLDQDEWVKFGATRTINFSSSSFYVGMAVTAHDNNRVATLTGSDIVVLPVEPAMS
jgi:hypothetical protein